MVFTTLKVVILLSISALRAARPISAWPAANCEAPRDERALAAVRDNINEGQRGQKGRMCTRESNDGGKNPRTAPVKFNVKGDVDEKAGSAHVNPGASAGTGAL